jgi:hypothetical protein
MCMMVRSGLNNLLRNCPDTEETEGREALD